MAQGSKTLHGSPISAPPHRVKNEDPDAVIPSRLIRDAQGPK